MKFYTHYFYSCRDYTENFADNFRSYTIWQVVKFWDEANGFIEGDILMYLLQVNSTSF